MKYDEKIQQKVPDFSGKHYGKISDKNDSTHVNNKEANSLK